MSFYLLTDHSLTPILITGRSIDTTGLVDAGSYRYETLFETLRAE